MFSHPTALRPPMWCVVCCLVVQPKIAMSCSSVAPILGGYSGSGFSEPVKGAVGQVGLVAPVTHFVTK